MGFIKKIEILLLDIGIWIYQQETTVAILVLGIPAVFLLVYQTFKEDKNLWAGFVGGLFCLLLLMHLLPGYRASTLEQLISLKSATIAASNRLAPVPFLEQFFSLTIAPVQFRFVWEEVFAVVLIC
ncbi:MAG: hypothetical protein NZO16_04155 [Deltaproteobacteria bacterium]|nr:hypothetical protein [Deltaproteobacteria bacterium]